VVLSPAVKSVTTRDGEFTDTATANGKTNAGKGVMKNAIIIVNAILLLISIVACSEYDSEKVSVWSVAALPEYGKPSLFAVDSRPASAAWAVGENGTILTYDDYLWKEYSLNLTEMPIYDIDVSSASIGWAVGTAGTMLRLVNSEWHTAPSVCTVDLYAVAIDSRNEGWAVGDAGCILRFDGVEWEVFEHDVNALSLHGVATEGDGTAWAVGDAGTILYYDGTAWENVNSPVTNTLYDIAVSPAGTFACGDGGVVLVRGAAGWATVNVETNATLRSIAVYDEMQGFIVGDANTILKLTENGWEAIELDLVLIDDPVNFKDVALVSGTEGWAVGSNGAILKYGPAENWHGDLIKNKWRENGD
jgi:photosystem II stability/assembly factor-like uncharacterized protein